MEEQHSTPVPAKPHRSLLWAAVLGAATALLLIALGQWLIVPAEQRITVQTRPEAPTLPLPFVTANNLPVPPIPLPPAPVIFRINTADPVVFITIDDGVHKPADAADYAIQHQLPMTAFLTTSMVRRDPGYFKRLQEQAGMEIENHTVNHPFMDRLPYTQQAAEICHASDELQQWYGARPTLFRPPYGEYDVLTKRAASACGIKQVVLWSAVLEKGKLEYQTVNGRLRPGDIVLLHFSNNLKRDLEVLQAAAAAEGLRFAKLADYLPR